MIRSTQAIREWADDRVLPVMGHGENQYSGTSYREPKINAKTGAVSQAITHMGHHYHIKFVPEIHDESRTCKR